MEQMHIQIVTGVLLVTGLFFAAWQYSKGWLRAGGKLLFLAIFSMSNILVLPFFAPSFQNPSVWYLIGVVIAWVQFGAILFHYVLDVSRKGNRNFYRLGFLYVMFIFPVMTLRSANIDVLCLAWLYSYLVCSTINRICTGFSQHHETKGAVWLKSEKIGFLEDILKFRSEFSLNNPGSHRQTLESFYPYFAVFCLVVAFSLQFVSIKPQSFNLTTALVTVDSEIFGKIVEDSDSEPPLTQGDFASKDPTAKLVAPKVPVETPNSMMLEVQRQSSDFPRVSTRAPNMSADNIKYAVDMAKIRNLIFLMLLVATVWIINAKSVNNSYVDKWRVLNQELSEIAKSSPAERANLKILFACNLVVTEMWGHRSFATIFADILTEQSIDFRKTQYTPEQIVTELQKVLKTSLAQAPKPTNF